MSFVIFLFVALGVAVIVALCCDDDGPGPFAGQSQESESLRQDSARESVADYRPECDWVLFGYELGAGDA